MGQIIVKDIEKGKFSFGVLTPASGDFVRNNPIAIGVTEIQWLQVKDWVFHSQPFKEEVVDPYGELRVTHTMTISCINIEKTI